MVALSPRMLLEIQTDIPSLEDAMPTYHEIDESTFEEYRLRTIGNTFREIIGELGQLEKWRASEDFQRRSKIMKDMKLYNALVQTRDS